MVARLKLMFVLAAVAMVLAPATPISAQDGGRFRVLIPYFAPLEGARNNFGKDASKELRSLMGSMPTHVAMDESDIKDEAKKFDLKIEDLTCITTRQLASQINVPVAICASYTAQPDKSWVVSAEVWDVAGGESFLIEGFSAGEKEHEAAALHIYEQFERYSTTVRSAAICNDYMASQQWDNALRNCDESLALNPSAIGTRYLRARILYELDRYPESLTELEAVIESNPFQEDALQLAGYIATVTDQPEKGRDYYSRYLDINPGNATIRMRIAYELAQAGDPVGAMEFIQVGLDVDPENVALHEQYGGFAFSAALEIQQLAAVGNQDAGNAVAPEAVGYYREAIASYEKVFEAKGAETPVGHLRNVISAYIQLDDIAAAVSLGERVLQTHAQEDGLWVLYADALQRSGRLDDAIVALDRVREINPEHPSAALRQGSWLIQAGRLNDAVTVLSTAAANDPAQAEQAARMIFAEAYQNGNQKENYDYAIMGMTAAKRLPNLSVAMTSQLNFWHGYSIYQIAVKEQEPQTLQTAQSSLPKFNQSVALLRQAGDYPASVNVNLTQLLENAATYIEIQDAIIKRGR
ncbi:MAG: tetratricopeptide repeat protein [Gemmatimonadetes bacterium]|nr:tetratricopeptide repeat protein [Gemmatimonadota bacterium]MDA1102810.1 tetratricopeptide repeat protein [Gemmatimonadota bacterium]